MLGALRTLPEHSSVQECVPVLKVGIETVLKRVRMMDAHSRSSSPAADLFLEYASFEQILKEKISARMMRVCNAVLENPKVPSRSAKRILEAYYPSLEEKKNSLCFRDLSTVAQMCQFSSSIKRDFMSSFGDQVLKTVPSADASHLIKLLNSVRISSLNAETKKLMTRRLLHFSPVMNTSDVCSTVALLGKMGEMREMGEIREMVEMREMREMTVRAVLRVASKNYLEEYLHAADVINLMEGVKGCCLDERDGVREAVASLVLRTLERMTAKNLRQILEWQNSLRERCAASHPSVVRRLRSSFCCVKRLPQFSLLDFTVSIKNLLDLGVKFDEGEKRLINYHLHQKLDQKNSIFDVENTLHQIYDVSLLSLSTLDFIHQKISELPLLSHQNLDSFVLIHSKLSAHPLYNSLSPLSFSRLSYAQQLLSLPSLSSLSR